MFKSNIRELKPTRRHRRQRRRHLKCTAHFCNHFSIIQSHFPCKMCSNYPGIKLEPALQNRTFVIIWSRRPYNRENRSFHIVERTRSLRCCAKMKNARAKRAKLYIFFYSQICKFVTFLLPSSSWLLISSLFASSQQRLRPTPFRSRSRV